VEISGTGTVLTTGAWVATGPYEGDDEGYAAVSLPFAFPFYGQRYTTIYIDANGQVGFSPFSTPTFTGTVTIPSAGYPNHRIAAFYADLNLGMVGPSGGGAVYVYHDTASRRFIIEWKDAQRYGGLGLAGTWEVMLYENGDILIQYLTVSGTLSYPVGIENLDGSAGLSYGTGIVNSLAIGFYQPSVSVRVDPRVITAGIGTATVTATVRGQNWSPTAPPDGTVVTFTTSLGSLTPPSTTTTSGVATSTLSAGVLCRTLPVTATASLTSTLVSSSVLATTGLGPTSVSGYVSSNTTWDICGAPWVVTADTIVSPTVTLVIEAGTRVEFASGARLIVLGTLNANGSSSLPIYMTSTGDSGVPGMYPGIVLGNNQYTASASFSYLQQSFGGQVHTYLGQPYQAAILAYRANAPTISDSSLANNAGDAVYLGAGTNATINGNSIRYNGRAGIYTINASPIITNNVILASTYGVYFAPGSAGQVTSNTVSSALEGIHITNASPLVSGNSLAGNTYGIYAGSAGSPSIQNNTIQNNNGIGIFVDTGSLGTILTNTVMNNGSGGIYIANAGPTVQANLVSNNGVFGVYLLSASAQVLTNTIVSNNPYGVYVRLGSPTVQGNTVLSSTIAGLYSDAASATISNNRLGANGSYGIIMNPSTGIVSNNIITGSGIAGIWLTNSSPTISSNQIYDNGLATSNGYGVYMTSASSPTLSSNGITNNVGTTNAFGVYATAGSKPSLIANTISGQQGGSGNGYGVYLVAL